MTSKYDDFTFKFNENTANYTSCIDDYDDEFIKEYSDYHTNVATLYRIRDLNSFSKVLSFSKHGDIICDINGNNVKVVRKQKHNEAFDVLNGINQLHNKIPAIITKYIENPVFHYKAFMDYDYMISQKREHVVRKGYPYITSLELCCKAHSNYIGQFCDPLSCYSALVKIDTDGKMHMYSLDSIGFCKIRYLIE